MQKKILRLVPSLLLASLCFSSTAYGMENTPSKRVHRTFAMQSDVTGDGKKETIRIQITGASMSSPFTWMLNITDNAGKPIYSITRNDARIDKFFSDEGYVTNCSGYIACKEKYYFTEIPEEIFGSTRPVSEIYGSDTYRLNILRENAESFLRKQGIASAKIEEAILEMQKSVNTPPYYSLHVPESPVQSGPSMVWVKCLDRFVPYYDD